MKSVQQLDSQAQENSLKNFENDWIQVELAVLGKFRYKKS